MTLNEAYITKGGEALSPFLPDTNIQFAWDSTSLSYIKTCPRLYYYIMIKGWSVTDQSVHLRFGIEYHQALQEFDSLITEGADREDAIKQVLTNLLERTWEWRPDEETRAGKYKNRRTLFRLVLDYLDFYNPDPATTYILQNGKPATELSFRFELDFNAPGSQQPYMLSGHLDRVVEYQDELFVMDRKTSQTTLSGHYFDRYDPDNQMSLYTLAGKTVLQSPIKGVIIDGAQVLLEDTNRFVRGITYRSQDRVDEWLFDLQHHFKIAEFYAKANYWPQNDTACDKYGGCRFRDICSKSPKVRENFLKANFVKQAPEERWNPLKPR